jgi:hypothetical protein
MLLCFIHIYNCLPPTMQRSGQALRGFTLHLEGLGFESLTRCEFFHMFSHTINAKVGKYWVFTLITSIPSEPILHHINLNFLPLLLKRHWTTTTTPLAREPIAQENTIRHNLYQIFFMYIQFLVAFLYKRNCSFEIVEDF